MKNKPYEKPAIQIVDMATEKMFAVSGDFGGSVPDMPFGPSTKGFNPADWGSSK